MSAAPKKFSSLPPWLEKLRIGLVPSVLLLGLVVGLRAAGLMQAAEWYCFDLLMRWQRPEPTDPRVVVIGIDETDIQAAGQYPLSDRQLANTISAIQRYQPRAIGIDIFRDFAVPPGSSELDALWATTDNLFGIQKALPPEVPAPASLPPERVGIVDAFLDADGRQRRIFLGTQTAMGFRFSFPLTLARFYLEAEGIILENGSRDPTAMRFGNVEFPRIYPNTGSYVRLPTGTGSVQSLLRFRAGKQAYRVLTLRDLHASNFEPDLLRDRIVLVGVTAPSARDYTNVSAGQSTISPSSNSVYGVELQAHAVSYILSAVLDGRPTIAVWPDPWDYLWIVLWGGLGLGIAAYERSPLRASIWATLGIATLIGMGYFGFLWGWWIPIVPAIAIFTLQSLGLAALYQYDRLMREKLARQKEVLTALENLNSQLETRVEARTAQLQQLTVELREAKETAEQASMAKSMFISHMSHELRTPLTAILGFCQAISSDPMASPNNRERAIAIDLSGEHLLKLINEILDLSKLEAGKTEADRASFQLSHAIEVIQVLFRLRIEQKGLSFNIDIAPDVPETLVGDEQKIVRVLVNLLGNALKFTERGSIDLQIATLPSPDRDNNSLQFQVSDTGVGIAPNEISKLFIPFEQTQSGRTASTGTGLGLAIGKHLVDLMGGEIHADSQLGRGSTFSFTIPLIYAERVAADKTPLLQVEDPSSFSEPPLTSLQPEAIAQALEGMPPIWLEKLQQAARELNGWEVQELLDDLPTERADVAAYLKTLAANFDYGTLIDLVDRMPQSLRKD